MKEFILSLIVVSFGLNLYASEGVLVCGDISETQNMKDCGEFLSFDCSYKISENKYIEPWMNIWLGATPSDASFDLSQKGPNTDMKLGKLKLETLNQDGQKSTLNWQISGLSGADQMPTGLTFHGRYTPNAVTGGALYEGELGVYRKATEGVSPTTGFGCIFK